MLVSVTLAVHNIG